MKIIIFIFFIFFFPLNTYSQEKPPGAGDAGRILNQENERQKTKEIPKQIPKSLLEESKKKEVKTSDEKVLIKSFKLEGDIKSFSVSELQNLLLDLNGKSLAFDQIQIAADRIKDFYNSKGFFLAQAIIPKQEIKDGVLIIFINEGKLDSKEPYKINKKNLRISEDRIKAYMDNALKDNFLKDSVERGLLNINDNPGVRTSLMLEPGIDPGSTKMVLDINEGPLVQGTVSVDNYGNRYTGDLRATASVDFNNPSGIGDQIGILGTKAIEGDLEIKKISYNFPIGTNGLRGGAFYSIVDFKVGKELSGSRFTGKAENANLNLKYPIYRSTAESLLTNFNYDKKYLYNATAGAATSDKELDNYTLGFTYQKIDQFISGGYTQVSINFTRGDLDLSKVADSLNTDQGTSGYKTNGSFNKQNLQLSRIQQLPEKFTLNFVGDAQFASKNLDTSEKMSLGGPSGVRAYPSGEASGDEGYRYSLDLRYSLGNFPYFGDITPLIFYDYGRIKQYKNKDVSTSSVTNNEYSLSGYGLGLEAANSNNFSLKFIAAHTNGGNPGASTQGNDSDGRKENTRYWVLANFNF
ncbi:MAG: ShlB/FhaC/HecB family hemolysin secretion/activation protein [Actinobacteria bacterium]|nr:ShlB/FhaC/HecB family hemolysin secretion/activation protein [Actinomycetota bacterium]NCX76148.1 ShlB/FhaC/HecB family hemolysin secretion/activation protein [Actinomycetota bacterium]NKA16476.1 ShlB/FhaC/HecB family hemolysin secretion/activation protein [Candidatus Fonsibacter sp. PEL55]